MERILSESVAQTLIKSAKRLTYLEAQALIDGDLREARKHAKTEPKYTDQLIKTLRQMDGLAKQIRARRRKQGMIHLDLPEVNLIFDDAGHVIDAEPEDTSFTHTLIEMFMVEANEVLARLFRDMDVPLLQGRVHPEPPPGDVQDLRQTAKVAGYSIPKSPTRQELQALLDATAGSSAPRGRPLRGASHAHQGRVFPRASSATSALASEAYAHFTSPIRRYPDLTVHRALAAYLSKTDNGRKPPKSEKDRKRLGRTLMEMGLGAAGVLDQDELVEIGSNSSRTENRAEEAERSLRQFLVLQLMSTHLGESFPALVTGVTGAGVFVQIEKYLAEGMIKDHRPSRRRGAGSVDQRSGKCSSTKGVAVPSASATGSRSPSPISTSLQAHGCGYRRSARSREQGKLQGRPGNPAASSGGRWSRCKRREAQEVQGPAGQHGIRRVLPPQPAQSPAPSCRSMQSKAPRQEQAGTRG